MIALCEYVERKVRTRPSVIFVYSRDYANTVHVSKDGTRSRVAGNSRLE